MAMTTLLGMGGGAGYGAGTGPGQGWCGMGTFMGFPGGGLVMLLVVAMAVYLVVRLIRPGTPRGPAPETPLDILRRRYASGEIDQETFERMKRELQGE